MGVLMNIAKNTLQTSRSALNAHINEVKRIKYQTHMELLQMQAEKAFERTHDLGGWEMKLDEMNRSTEQYLLERFANITKSSWKSLFTK